MAASTGWRHREAVAPSGRALRRGNEPAWNSAGSFPWRGTRPAGPFGPARSKPTAWEPPCALCPPWLPRRLRRSASLSGRPRACWLLAQRVAVLEARDERLVQERDDRRHALEDVDRPPGRTPGWSRRRRGSRARTGTASASGTRPPGGPPGSREAARWSDAPETGPAARRNAGDSTSELNRAVLAARCSRSACSSADCGM